MSGRTARLSHRLGLPDGPTHLYRHPAQEEFPNRYLCDEKPYSTPAVLWPSCIGARGHSAAGVEYGFYFKNRRTSARIPFQFQSNLIIIKVQINGRDSAQFIVDTGVNHTIITDAKVFHQPGFSASRTISMAGVGEGKTLLASISTDNTISLGPVRIDHHSVVVLHEDVLKLSEYAGVPIHGIIGYELFANLVVTIDFQNYTISLTQPDHYRYRPGKGERYPIFIQENKAYTDVLSVSNGTDSLPLRVLLDTGAGQALLLDRSRSSLAIPLPGKMVRVSLGWGLNGLISGHVGRLPKINLGRFALNDVLVSYPDSTDFGRKLSHMPQRQGSVGCELLRRFRVTFNYPAGYMVLKPVKRIMRESFEHDMSGLELKAQGDHFDHLLVAQVARDSPAKTAGLQVGDEVLTVNYNEVNTLTISRIYRMLQAGEGKSVFMLIRRQNRIVACHFSLKRLI